MQDEAHEAWCAEVEETIDGMAHSLAALAKSRAPDQRHTADVAEALDQLRSLVAAASERREVRRSGCRRAIGRIASCWPCGTVPGGGGGRVVVVVGGRTCWNQPYAKAVECALDKPASASKMSAPSILCYTCLLRPVSLACTAGGHAENAEDGILQPLQLTFKLGILMRLRAGYQTRVVFCKEYPPAMSVISPASIVCILVECFKSRVCFQFISVHSLLLILVG